MIRLCLDEDFMNRAVRVALLKAGVGVVSAWEVGMKARADPDHLAFATARGEVMLSCNIRDFARIHPEWLREGRTHAGMILVEQHRFGVGELIRRITLLSHTAEPADMVDRIEFISDWG